MINSLMYLQRRNKVLIPNDGENNKVYKSYIVTAMKNLESYGYTFSENLVLAMQNVSEDKFINWYTKNRQGSSHRKTWGVVSTICLEVAKVCGQALINIYSDKEALGKVFID